MPERGDLYISVDVEADGPIPGPYSMLSFGLAVAGAFDGERFEAHDPAAATFYRELRPIAECFDAEALAVSGLDRERLKREGSDPAAAMADAAAWVSSVGGARRPVLVGYPLVFDWMWLHWYFERFAGGSPFGHSGGLDMKTMYQQKAGVLFARAVRRHMPPALRTTRQHTHHALDDAIEQAELFAALSRWEPDAQL